MNSRGSISSSKFFVCAYLFALSLAVGCAAKQPVPGAQGLDGNSNLSDQSGDMTAAEYDRELALQRGALSQSAGSGRNVVYIVKKRGETLGSIARKYSGDFGSWKEIAKFNPSIKGDRIKVGDRIVIPASALKSSVASRKSSNLAKADSQHKNKMHSDSVTDESVTSDEANPTNSEYARRKTRGGASHRKHATKGGGISGGRNITSTTEDGKKRRKRRKSRNSNAYPPAVAPNPDPGQAAPSYGGGEDLSKNDVPKQEREYQMPAALADESILSEDIVGNPAEEALREAVKTGAINTPKKGAKEIAKNSAVDSKTAAASRAQLSTLDTSINSAKVSNGDSMQASDEGSQARAVADKAAEEEAINSPLLSCRGDKCQVK